MNKGLRQIKGPLHASVNTARMDDLINKGLRQAILSPTISVNTVKIVDLINKGLRLRIGVETSGGKT